MAVKSAKTGVWLVVTGKGGYDEHLHAVLPGDQKAEAHLYQEAQGYGDVVWEPFAKVSES